MADKLKSAETITMNTGMQAESNQDPPSFSQMALGDGTPRKAFLTALVVGTVLAAINHGDTIMLGEWPSLVKIFLTYCVPYCVTTWGAITGKKAQWRRDHAAQSRFSAVTAE